MDRACIACHNGEGKAFDLRGGKKDKLGYGTSYLNLHPYVHRQGGEGDMVVLQPYEYHPNTSELVRMLKKGHFNVQLTDKEWKTLYNWIDYNAPDKGYFNANVLSKDIIPYQGFDQIKRRKELTDKYANGAGVDWKKEISDYAAYLKGKGEIKPEMPEKLAPVKEKELKVKGWPFDADRIKAMLADEKETRKEIELAPGIKMTFVRIPAGQFVMGSYRGQSDTRPTAKVKIDKAFWMGELEVTNQQFNVIFPDHDSRFVDQQWKDHVVQGYPANKPEQPVIRVSYNDAMDYCKKLSEKTGLNITLPTEAQWEWACRAGSDQDFWYGDMNADFGKKDNLADVTTLLLAASGIDRCLRLLIGTNTILTYRKRKAWMMAIWFRWVVSNMKRIRSVCIACTVTWRNGLVLITCLILTTRNRKRSPSIRWFVAVLISSDRNSRRLIPVKDIIRTNVCST